MADLLEAIISSRKGDLGAYGSVVEALQSRAVSYAWHVMGNYNDAEDAAQESFVQAWQKLTTLRDDAAFVAWFYQILTNNMRRKFRGTKNVESLEDHHYHSGDSEKDPQVLYHRKEQQEKVQQAIRTLPQHSRSVLILRDLEEFSYEEIARILKIPLGTVKSRLFSARESLQKVLFECEGKDA